MDEKTLAALLGLTVSGVRKLRAAGTGPKSFRIGKRALRYRVADVRQWLAEREQVSSAPNVVAMRASQ